MKNFLGFGLYIILFRVFVFLFPFLVGGILYYLWPRFRNKRTLLIGVPSVLVVSLILTLSKMPPFMTIAPIIMPDLPPYGYVPESSRQAVEEVRNQHRQDVDLVKLYDGLTEEQFLAAAAEAKDLGMYVISHLPDQIQLETILRSGTDEIAHIDEFNMFHLKGTRDQIMANFQKGIDPKIDYTLIPATVEIVRENGISVVSNMSADEVTYQMIFDTPAVLERPEYKVIRPEVLETWRTSGRPITSFATQGPYREKEMDFFKALIKSMYEADIVITIGTDASDLVEGTLPYKIHRELELLVEAGLSNYEALEAGTKNAALIVKKMGKNGDFGTIARGQRADLILLPENPLENVSHTRNRIGVMARGQWFTQGELDRLVDEFIASMNEESGLTASRNRR